MMKNNSPFSQDVFDFSNDNSLSESGFRLHCMEVWNWGTFNKKVWKIEPDGFNSLLTGDIGSGKTTFVDAITSLLVPHQRIVYNKAAGPDSNGRSLISYVKGEYKKEYSEFGNSSKSVFLRDDKDYSVLLAYFCSEGYGEKITLAQVFWNGKENKIEKFFVISDRELNITEHFCLEDEEKNVLSLKKRLKSMDGVSIFESFSDYSLRFRRDFGMKSDKALNLFYQTISMKSIGSLNEFVRNHMLEELDIKPEIEKLIKNNNHLTKSYEEVQKAKTQLNYLEPLIENIDDYESLKNTIDKLNQCLFILPVYFAVHKSVFFKKEIENLSSELAAQQKYLTDMRQNIEKLRIEEANLRLSINLDQKGRRIEELKRQIRELNESKARKFNYYEQYKTLLNNLKLSQTINEETFYQVLEKTPALLSDVVSESGALKAKRDELVIQQSNFTDILNSDKTELTSLKQRKTQIPSANLNIRLRMLEDLQLNDGFPFVGELLTVKSKDREWEGAIERLLHNFGLSVLIPEAFYSRVSKYVERTDLKGKLAYFTVLDSIRPETQKDISEKSLFNKVEIKPNTPFYDWLNQELRESFDYICCDTIEQFQRETSCAITINGQIKGGRLKHQKDDRKNISDRTSYVLGWSNHEKIKATEIKIAEIEKQIKKIDNDILDNDKQQETLGEQTFNLRDLAEFTDFTNINWQKDELKIEELKTKIVELEKDSETLQSLKKELAGVQENIESKEKSQGTKAENIGRIKTEIENHKKGIRMCEGISVRIAVQDQNTKFLVIADILGDRAMTIETIDKIHEERRKFVEDDIRTKTEENRKIENTIIGKMSKYKNNYLSESVDVPTFKDSISEYRQLYNNIKEKNLPKYEKEFKESLIRGSINDIALFNSELLLNGEDIEEKIRQINEPLKEILYNPGTYIELQAKNTQNLQIKEFKFDLRKCLDNSFEDTNTYTEEKFNNVKQLLDKFQSSEQSDINWTTKVTDVRNWFEFSAIEKWLVNDTEKELYNDSSGKSGGQKEKLAYTILGSALVYQFGIEQKGTKSKSFRFVVLDEAFSRGSDESTRYGLNLFKELNLQLLVVTPLQKINIIENYIEAIHFVSNESGNDSVIKNITYQEYVKEKEASVTLLNYEAVNVNPVTEQISN